MSLTIREIIDSDSNDLFVIRNNPQVYKWFKKPIPIDKIQHQAWIDERCKEYSHLTIVATHNDTVIAVAYLTKIGRREASVSISVLPNMQNLKVGSKLLKQLINNGVSSGINRIIAEIHFKNTNSISLFEFHDFKRVRNRFRLLEKSFYKFEIKI